MASILLVSGKGSGIPVALRLAQEGNLVQVWFKDQQGDTLKGFRNPRIVKTMVHTDGYDLVLGDMVGSGSIGDQLYKKGRLVIGCGSFNDKLELDRAYAQKVVGTLLPEVKVPKSEEFTEPSELAEYIKSAKTPQVLKPSGNKATSLTLVSSDPSNRTLLSQVENLGQKVLPCIVQERVDGVEMSTEGWFDGEDFVAFNHTIEWKRFMEGDKGPQTGCMGNVVWVCKEDKAVKACLLPLKELLQKVEYLGPIDLNCIYKEDEVYFLEFTARFGYDAIQALAELYRKPLYDFFESVATRSIKEGSWYSDSYGIAVRLSVPPWPAKGNLDESSGVHFLEVPKEARKHVWLMDVKMENDMPALAGIDGILGCVTARGETVRECRRRVYRTVDNIVRSKEVQYRLDIGAGVEQKIAQLGQWGWIDEPESIKSSS